MNVNPINSPRPILLLVFSILAVAIFSPTTALGASPSLNDVQSDLLSDTQFDAIEMSMDRALRYLDSLQRRDGSYPAEARAQPAITGLCVMAFMSRGHLPGRGPYGEKLLRAVEFILSCQQSTGLLARVPPESEYTLKGASHTAPYNHGIGCLTLSEVYGMVDASRDERIRRAIHNAVQYSIDTQIQAPGSTVDAGGWGYTPPYDRHTTDLSVVSWQIMGLRAAKNAGFEVPAESIARAMAYVENRFDEASGGFEYAEAESGPRIGMTGVGILMLSLGGKHGSKISKAAAEWLLKNPWTYDPAEDGDSSEYPAYYVSQAALQLGHPYWPEIYPRILRTVLSVQQPNGSWRPSPHGAVFGEAYTTAMYTLTLGAPLQLLPIYQR